MVIVHVCGAPGSGKTTLGARLRKYYRTRVVVQELADLERQFVAKYSEDALSPVAFARNYQKLYQTYIAAFIARTAPRPIIFIGANMYPEATDVVFRLGRVVRPAMHFDVCSTHNFYISLPTNAIARRRHVKEFEQSVDKYKAYLLSKRDAIVDRLLASVDDTSRELATYMTKNIFKVAEVYRETTEYHNFYKFRGYTMLEPDQIYAAMRKILP